MFDFGDKGVLPPVPSNSDRPRGHIMFRATEACQAPFVEAFCYGTREDEWVVAHCGPIKVHLFTRETREQYQLEVLYRSPEYFFQPGDFPHYIEVPWQARCDVGDVCM